MMEFIVLGQIPGTSIYLSFPIVAVAVTAVILTVTIYKILSPWRSIKKNVRQIYETAL